ncbi:hypothetical protein TUM4433_10700 [Shewanella schlegeliana]|nr:hypothetical protein TUM4433_10700 [Shewanella schlegeliana]
MTRVIKQIVNIVLFVVIIKLNSQKSMEQLESTRIITDIVVENLASLASGNESF